ncbi:MULTISPECIES: DinB family protein [unclassified Amycolatopsis]|uniref:DinB family protein n=1 Tax=unclassified Amycolatopsis TaxID=2618356 RepID=UPI002876606C|nr:MULTISPECIES: DinB family protein [unclassified Amycolatopsis]MDS0134929.1 DinB family protein [Amycolatopsis sp. 505]MDS0148757.1 DinB family protein [Amycolatopsis sp. CM201R]
MAGNVRPVADERDGLLSFLEQQRYVLRLAAHGLTDEQARLTSTKSTLSVGGLIKHVASTEYGWMDTVLQVPQKPFDEAVAEYEDAHRLRPDETLAGVLARYDEVAARTAEVIAGIEDLGQAVPVPKGVPWFPQDVEAWSVRWVLLHLIQETARHAGHADIIREHIDGATAFPLMAAAEGWPESPFIKPWTPTTQPA